MRAQPGPTGLALLTLAGEGPLGPVEEAGASYLLRTLPSIRAPVSLGWGLLGLRAWGVRPVESGRWLNEAYAGATGKSDAPMKLAMLLLAAAEGSLTLFGRRSKTEGT